MASRKLEIQIVGENRSALSSISQVDSKLGGLGRALTAPLRGIGNLTNALGKIGLAGLGISTLANAFTSPIGAASDLSESVNKLNVVLGDSAQGVLDWASTSAQAFGQSKQQAIAAAAGFSNLFVSMGKGQAEAADLSMDIVALASDLASFNNMTVDESLEKLRAGLVGETEPLRSLGVNINAAAVEAEGLALGLVSAGQEMTDAQKVTARYSLIMKQTATAHGDFAETSTGLANAQRIISASFQDISAQIGGRLLPLVAPLVSSFATALPAAIDTLNGVLDALGGYFRAVFEDGDYLNDFLRDLPGPIQPIVEGFGRLVAVVKDVLSYLDAGRLGGRVLMLEWFGPDFGPVLDRIVGSIKDTVGAVIDLGGAVKDLVTGDIDFAGFVGRIAAALGGLGQSLLDRGDALLDLGALLIGDAAEAGLKLAGSLIEAVGQIPWGAVWSSAVGVGASLLSSLGNIAADVQAWVGEQFAGIAWDGVWSSAVNIGAGLLSGLGSIVGDIQTWVGEQFAGITWDGIWSGAVNIGAGLVSGLGSIGGDLLQWVKDQWATLADKWPAIWSGAGNIVMGLRASVADFGGSVVTWITEAWAFLKDKWPAVWQGAGDIVAGLLASVADFGGNVVAWVTDAWGKLSTEWPAIWQGAGDIGAGLLASGLSIGADVVAWLKGAWTTISSAQWGEVWASALNIGAGIVAGGLSIVSDVQKWLETTWGSISWPEVWATATSFVSSLALFIGDALELAIKEAKTEGVEPPPSFVEQLRTSIDKTMRDIGQGGVKFLLGGFLDADWKTIGPAITAKINELFTGALLPIFGPGVPLVAVLITGFSGLLSGVVEGLREVAKERFGPLGSSIVEGLILGMGGFVPLLLEAAGGMINQLVATVTGLLESGSPSQVFVRIGQDIVNGLVAGVAGLAEAVGAAVGSIPTAIAGAAGTVLDGALILGQNIVTGLTTGAAGLLAALGTILGQITGWIGGTALAVLALAQSIGGNLVTAITNGAATLVGALATILGTISGWIGSTAATVLTTATTIGSNLVAAIESGAASLVGMLAGVWADISGWISDTAASALSVATSIGTNLGQGIIDGINGMIDAVSAAAADLGNIATSVMSAVTGEHSPSTVTRETGRNLGRGLVLGIEDQRGEVLRTARALAADAASILATGMLRGSSDIAWAVPEMAAIPAPFTPDTGGGAYWTPYGGGGRSTSAAGTVVNNYATINTAATTVNVPDEFQRMRARSGRY